MLHSFRNHFFKVCCLYFKTNQCAASSKNNKLRQSLEVRMLLNILAKLFSLCKLNFYFKHFCCCEKQSVSNSWDYLNWVWWFSFRLEQIFGSRSAIPQKNVKNLRLVKNDIRS